MPSGADFWRQWRMVAGPALLVGVGYMDPGNWATDLAAGTQFGYELVWVILMSSLAAMFLQNLAARVALVTGKDLAQLSRQHYSRRLNLLQWLCAELAIIACDVAEVLGAALALHLLFGCSLMTGLILTAFDTLLVLGLKGRGFRQVEAIVLALILTIAGCFVAEMVFAQPVWGEVGKNLVPSFSSVASPERLLLAIGIVGATVMPHNLYLHSSVVLTRRYAVGDLPRALKLNLLDTVLSLTLAFCVNAAILLLAASAFHGSEVAEKVTGIADAYHYLTPALGVGTAMLCFGVALLASGQSATLTGTIAGQVILEGYLNLKIPCWVRRVITRALALIPAIGGIWYYGDGGVDKLLILSQVILGLQLPLIMWPLLRFGANRGLMQEYRLSALLRLVGWGLFATISVANAWLLYEMLA